MNCGVDLKMFGYSVVFSYTADFRMVVNHSKINCTFTVLLLAYSVVVVVCIVYSVCCLYIVLFVVYI